MSRQRKVDRVRPGAPGGAETDNSRLWLTRAALGLAGLALVGIAAFLLGHQQGADSVIGALQSQGVQALPDEPDTYPSDEPEQVDEVPGDEAQVEQGTTEEVPAVEELEPADSDSNVAVVDAEDGSTDEDEGTVEVSGDLSIGDSSGLAVDVNAAVTVSVGDSSAVDAPAEPAGTSEPDVQDVSLGTETTQPETALPEAARPESVEPQVTEAAVREWIAEAPVQATPEVRTEPSAGTELIETQAAQPRLYSVDPRPAGSDAALPGQVEPQEIGTSVGTVGADDVVLVAGG